MTDDGSVRYVGGMKDEITHKGHEVYSNLKLPSNTWTVVRVDGRGFSSLTEKYFEKPFDFEFSVGMQRTTERLIEEFNAPVAYFQSDEISIILPPSFDMFGKRVEKIDSLAAGIASAYFTLFMNYDDRFGGIVTFDSRVCVYDSVDEVIEYLKWRRRDSLKNAVSTGLHWAYINAGFSAKEAHSKTKNLSSYDKLEILEGRFPETAEELDGHFGTGSFGVWEDYKFEGYNPISQESVPTTRRRIIFGDSRDPDMNVIRKILEDQ